MVYARFYVILKQILVVWGYQCSRCNRLSSARHSYFNPYPSDDRLLLMQETNPWWRVDLQHSMYVYKVVIVKTATCCQITTVPMEVTIQRHQPVNKRIVGDQCGKRKYFGSQMEYRFTCEPPVIGRFVKISLLGNNVTVVFCTVAVSAYGKIFYRPFAKLAAPNW